MFLYIKIFQLHLYKVQADKPASIYKVNPLFTIF